MRVWVVLALLVGCGGSKDQHEDASVPDLAVTIDASIVDMTAGDAAMPTCVMPTSPQSCTPPSGTTLPPCTLALTGCMDATNPTQMASTVISYEVNSPLWSDGAAKARGFVLPSGGKIHVKDCSSPSAECTSPNGVPNGTAETGRWVFPVGTVMVKSFEFDGKLVETRLLERVDSTTAALFGPGTDWVGFTYQWNEAQTEAVLVDDTRVTTQFDTGMQTVTWNYPSRQDCLACHTNTVGTLGPETAQMNRMVNGANQIDAFVAAGLFDSTAPQKPYAGPLVEPYANASLGLVGPPMGTTAEDASRSYLSANCGFCHRPDVHDTGFDLRWQLSFADTKICNAMAYSPIGIMSGPKVVFAPGDHTQSSMWVRMNIPVPSDDPHEYTDIGRMPPLSSFGVDQQAVDLLATWIDGVAMCP